MTYVLGLNAYHADSAACLLREGEIVAAAEEERFRRIKHWAGMPTQAVAYCLREAGLDLTAVDHVAINRNPRANLLSKALFSLRHRPSLDLVASRLKNASRVASPLTALAEGLGVGRDACKAQLHSVEHHRAHLASAFYVSPFHEAAVISIDGFGDFSSGMAARGRGAEIEEISRTLFPHSLGLFYQAITQFLGFWNYGDEYKVMGLAPYGEPVLADEMSRLVRFRPPAGYELSLDHFRHHTDGVEMRWDGGAPEVGQIFTERLEELLGPRRAPGEEITQHHKNIAASLQATYEDVFLQILNTLHRETGETAVCISGGCGMNSVANGKVLSHTPFERLYIPAAAGDAGGAIGAAFCVWHDVLRKPRRYRMEHAYLGPGFSQHDLGAAIKAKEKEFDDAGCSVELSSDEGSLCAAVAEAVAAGSVVGWFQGRMEWGPRALGNRSIICDPRRSDMKAILNEKIKRRESFRPFAPSILREAVAEWFETDADVPFMLQVYQIREEKRAQIPAVTHVNGSGRLQTVTEAQNPRYYRLISAMRDRTGIPIVLNTSFNESEPVVCRPEEAIDCFLRTNMDMLVLGGWRITRG